MNALSNEKSESFVSNREMGDAPLQMPSFSSTNGVDNHVVGDLDYGACSHSAAPYAIRMMALLASAVGKTITKSPAVEVLSEPKSRIATVGLV